MEETGYCWKCGMPISKGLFCSKPKNCEEQYLRNQERQVRRGKKAGYGLAGSTH